MRTTNHFALLFVGMVTVLNGCNSYTQRDVTKEPEFWGGYFKNNVYQLKQPVFLLEVQDNNEKRLALSPEGTFEHRNRFYSVPKSIEVYNRSGGITPNEVTGRSYQLPTEVKSVIGTGIRIKCTKLVLHHRTDWFFGDTEWTRVYAIILDGKHANTMVDITDLSVRNMATVRNQQIAVYAPDSRLLMLLKKP